MTSACLAVTDRVCVCEMEGVSVSCGSVGYIFFPIIPAGLRSPLCSHAHI